MVPAARAVPNELSDYIIDFLHKDHVALRACSLTCRAWVPTARYHLFAAVVLSTPNLFATFNSLLRAAPHLAAYVEELAVAKHFLQEEYALHHPKHAPIEHALTPLVGQLASLTKLTISELDLQAAGDLARLGSPIIADLSLYHCQFADFADLADLVCAFPALRRLALTGLQWCAEERAQRAPAPAPRIRRLLLGRDMDQRRLLDWLAAQGLHTSIEDFAIRCTWLREGNLIGPFLDLAGPALRRLDMDWSLLGLKITEAGARLTLGTCTALEHLTLQFPVHYNSSLPWLIAFLASQAAPTIRTMNWEIRLLGHIDGINWKAIGDVLCSPTYANLQRLTFTVLLWPGVHGGFADVQDIIHERLAALKAKGVLRVARA